MFQQKNKLQKAIQFLKNANDKVFLYRSKSGNNQVYVDEGISVRSMERLALIKIEDRLIDVLLVYRLVRLARSVRDLHNILNFLEKHSCQFRSVGEIYDTLTAMERKFITIVAAISEWESANLGKRSYLGLIEKVKQGERSTPAKYVA